MNLKEIEKKIFSSDSREVYSAINYIEAFPLKFNYNNLLIEKLKKEKNIFVIIKILEIARKILNEELFMSCFNILKNNQDEYVKATLVKTLSFSKSKKYNQFILANLKSDDPRVRANSVDAVENLKLIQNISCLIELLKDEDPRVRINAARAIYIFGDNRMLKIFKKLLTVNDTYIQESVLHTLDILNTKETFSLMKNFFDKTNNERLILRLLDIFSKTADDSILPLIRKHTANFNKKIAESAEFCLESILKNKNKFKICSDCRNKNPRESSFCGGCGKKFD
ncbi:MAG: HEAT repeat domain-containing protein [Candidatus Muiribacteriota bacterium]